MKPTVAIIDVSNEGLGDVVLTGLKDRLHFRPSNTFHIDCKYYTVDFVVNISDCANIDILNNCEASIICFDPEKDDSWSIACKFQETSMHLDVPIRLLICNQLANESLRKKVFSMALANQFEVVELNQSPETIDDGDEYGLARIRSSLEAHTWPGMQMKDQPTDTAGTYVRQKLQSDLKLESKESKTTTPEEKNSLQTNISTSFDVESFPVPQEPESFEDLFSQLLTMKFKLGGMKDSDRRRKAEEMTLKFWNAVGGDADEVAGLSADSPS